MCIYVWIDEYYITAFMKLCFFFYFFIISYLFFLCRENDVAAIDVNMGCPKEYSTKVLSYSRIFIFFKCLDLH